MKPFAKLCVALGCFLAWTATAADEQSPQPNFIIFIADDMGWNDCGAYGHPTLRTPNIDRLAREGMRFDRAFLTTSSCSPSRCSILTGRYPHATGAPELHQPLPADQILFTTPLRNAGYYTASAGKWHLGNAAIAQFDKVTQGGGPSGAEQWVQTLRDRPRDKPFFFWFAAVDAHRPYGPGAAEPPHTPRDVIVPPFLPDTPETREDLALYYDEVTRFDQFIGKALDELDAQSVADNTFVLVISDNGRPFPRCKTTLYDSGIRTPFIVRYPRGVKPRSTRAQVVSVVDIAPTILQLAGVEIGHTFQGKSLVPVLRGAAEPIRTLAFAEHNWHDYTAYERSVRSVRFLYIRNFVPHLPGTPPADAVRSPTYSVMLDLYAKETLPHHQSSPLIAPRPAEEFYDTALDPYQLQNLADNPIYAKAMDRHRKALNRWRKQTNDVMPDALTPDGFHRQTGEKLR